MTFLYFLNYITHRTYTHWTHTKHTTVFLEQASPVKNTYIKINKDVHYLDFESDIMVSQLRMGYQKMMLHDNEEGGATQMS